MNIGELYSNGVLRGPGNCIMDPGQAGVPNTPNYVPTRVAHALVHNRHACGYRGGADHGIGAVLS